MRKVILSMLVTPDGYFEGPNREIDWHNVDAEFNQLAEEQLRSADALLFGRMTYRLMAEYWPTEQGRKDDPVIAGWMNRLPKVVFSRTLKAADWENTRLVHSDAAEEVERLKRLPGKDLVIFGSSDLCATLMERDLIDEFRLIVNPVLLGNGKTLFAGFNKRYPLKLLSTRTFASGNVQLTYAPAKRS